MITMPQWLNERFSQLWRSTNTCFTLKSTKMSQPFMSRSILCLCLFLFCVSFLFLIDCEAVQMSTRMRARAITPIPVIVSNTVNMHSESSGSQETAVASSRSSPTPSSAYSNMSLPELQQAVLRLLNQNVELAQHNQANLQRERQRLLHRLGNNTLQSHLQRNLDMLLQSIPDSIAPVVAQFSSEQKMKDAEARAALQEESDTFAKKQKEETEAWQRYEQLKNDERWDRLEEVRELGRKKEEEREKVQEQAWKRAKISEQNNTLVTLAAQTLQMQALMAVKVSEEKKKRDELDKLIKEAKNSTAEIQIKHTAEQLKILNTQELRLKANMKKANDRANKLAKEDTVKAQSVTNKTQHLVDQLKLIEQTKEQVKQDVLNEERAKTTGKS